MRQGPTKLEGGRAWHRLLTGLVVLFLVNVASQFAYFVMSIVIGGDAVHGKVVGGQYLLRRVSTSGYIDVPRWVWEYSRWHANVNFALTYLAAAWFFAVVLLFATEFYHAGRSRTLDDG